ncbi:hypothetical protein [Microbacterium sp. PMB16]|uniref:hypothetical protein n=1 Tax=Microbacterium sp. PMB16 TaxID=3120157 RepID=UPI003F4C4E52
MTIMLNPSDTTEAPATKHAVPERSIVHIDPDFHMPAHGERGNSYLRAMRILFPKAT